MKLAFRYVLILILLVFLALCYYRHRWKYEHSSRWRRSLPQTYSGTYQKHQPPSMPIPLPEFLQDHNKCRMETCFNFTKCSGRPFKGKLDIVFEMYSEGGTGENRSDVTPLNFWVVLRFFTKICVFKKNLLSKYSPKKISFRPH